MNNLSNNDINNNNNDSSNNSIDTSFILSLILPIVITPIIGGLGWIISNVISSYLKDKNDTKDKKEKYMLDKLHDQISIFYWPMYINIIRYMNFLETYKNFKEGQISISSKESNTSSDTKDSPIIYDDTLFDFNINENNINNINVNNINNEKNININNINENNNINTNIESNEAISSNIYINRNRDIRLHNILEQYSDVIDFYEETMIETLLTLKKIYTENMTIAEPEHDILKLLIKLDRFITYIHILHVKKNKNHFIKDKIDFNKFPKEIYYYIEEKLHKLRESQANIINSGKYINKKIIIENELVKPPLLKSLNERESYVLLDIINNVKNIDGIYIQDNIKNNRDETEL